jgi:hypothetical protein
MRKAVQLKKPEKNHDGYGKEISRQQEDRRPYQEQVREVEG